MAPFQRRAVSSRDSELRDVVPSRAYSECQTQHRGDVPPPTFAALPTELHLLIASHLPYPDALSLKHTSRHFYGLVNTGVKLKVAWLISRHELHLDCPTSRCDLRTDSNFCKGSVSRLMRRRRLHIECESRPGLGCLVYNTPQCTHRAALAGQVWKSLFRSLVPRSAAVGAFRVITSLVILVLAVFLARLGLDGVGFLDTNKFRVSEIIKCE